MDSIEFNLPVILGAALLLGGGLLLAGSTVGRLLPGLLATLKSWDHADDASSDDDATAVPSTDSDRLAPVGFIDHVAVILQASRGCPADVQIQYVAEGLTEAETLRREVQRLSGSDERLNTLDAVEVAS